MGSKFSLPSSENEYYFDIAEIEKWTIEDVCRWVIEFSKEHEAMAKLSVQSIIQHQIDGPKLLTLDDEMLQKLNVKKSSHREDILRIIDEIRSLRKAE
jgi:hypothetical protein